MSCKSAPKSPSIFRDFLLRIIAFMCATLSCSNASEKQKIDILEDGYPLFLEVYFPIQSNLPPKMFSTQFILSFNLNGKSLKVVKASPS